MAVAIIEGRMFNRPERYGRLLSFQRDFRKRFPENALQHTPDLQPSRKRIPGLRTVA
jgi:hypothetical protein